MEKQLISLANLTSNDAEITIPERAECFVEFNTLSSAIVDDIKIPGSFTFLKCNYRFTRESFLVNEELSVSVKIINNSPGPITITGVKVSF